MTQLSKTQIDLLKRAAGRYHGLVSISTGYISSRRKGAYGARAADAAAKLVEAGLLMVHSRASGVQHLAHRFGADRWSETTFAITDAGRAAVEGR